MAVSLKVDTEMGDSVIEEAMMATSLMDDGLIDGTYDAYADMTFSANLCDVVQDEMGIYHPEEEQELYVNRSKRLMCKRCGKHFKNKVLLKRHSAMHTKELIFECSVCPKRFNRKESLTRHALVHSGMKFFECPDCGRMFNQNGHLRTHMLVHTKEKNYECERCNMKFARKDNMKRHSMLHNRDKTHECNICGKRFNQNGHLESHMLVHTQERNFECQECTMRFARKDTLKRHMLVHTREKTYECEYCSKKFIQNSHLKAHILVHTREKNYGCTSCDKKFARKGSLKRHMLVHTGERNFECTDCGKTFIQKTHLNKHQIIHTGPRVKVTEDHVDEFIQNIHKVEVQIEHYSPEKSEVMDEDPSQPENTTSDEIASEPVSLVSSKADPTKTSPKGNPPTSAAMSQASSMPCIPNSNSAMPSTTDATALASTNPQQNPQPINVNNMQVCNAQATQTYSPANLATKPKGSQNPPSETQTQTQDASQMQPNNLLTNSNSVMALALIDHFLTGNESQDNPAASESAARGKTNNQWSQKTQQELLAAQTLSVIGQRPAIGKEGHQHHYGQGVYVTPQVSACNLQPMPQGVLTSGPATMKIRPQTNIEWMAQDKVIVHPQNVVYNIPPPAHEMFRYYAPANMPLHHPPNNRDMGLFKDPRYPDPSGIPVDVRASSRKPKFPQKVMVPVGEWHAPMGVAPGAPNPNMPVYAHIKHPSEFPRLLDKP